MWPGSLIMYRIHWADPSLLFAHRARPSEFNCENLYLVLALGAETAVVGSVVSAFRRLKKPRSRQMSARGYALPSLPPTFLPFPERHFASDTTTRHHQALNEMKYLKGNLIRCHRIIEKN